MLIVKIVWRNCLQIWGLVLLVAGLNAQTPELVWSSPVETSNTTEIYPIGFAEGKYLFLQDAVEGGQHTVTLLMYGAQLANGSEKKLFDYGKGNDAETTELLQAYFNSVTGTICAVFYVADGRKQLNGIRLLRFTPDGEAVGESISLAKSAPDGSGGKLVNADAGLLFSPDSSQVGVFYELPASQASAPSRLFVKVFSADFSTTQWEATVQLPFTEKEGPLHEVVLDNGGRVYLEIGIDHKSQRKLEGKTVEKYRYYVPTEQGLYQVKPDGSLTSIPLDFGTGRFDKPKPIKTFQLFSDDAGNGHAVGIGGISYKSQVEDFLQTSTWDSQTGQLSSTVRNELAGLYDQLPGNQKFSFVFQQAFPKRDQGGVVIAEQLEAEQGSATGTVIEAGPPVWNYYHGAILVLNLHADNSIAWMRLIPKLQHTAGKSKRYGSYFVYPYKDNLLFFYTDNPENVSQLAYSSSQFANKSREMKDAVTILATVSSDGTLEKQLIPGTETSSGYTIVASEMKTVGSNQLLCVARWRTNYKLGLITLTN